MSVHSSTFEIAKGVVLTSETEEPCIILTSESEEPAVKAAAGIILTSETSEPCIVKDADEIKLDGDSFVFDFTAKGIILSSETEEPCIFDPDGDGYTATDDLWEFMDAALENGGQVAIVWGDDDVVDQIVVTADSLDFL